MPPENKGKTDAPPEASESSPVNKARAAFEEYRKKYAAQGEAASSGSHVGAPGHAAGAHTHFPGMPVQPPFPGMNPPLMQAMPMGVPPYFPGAGSPGPAPVSPIPGVDPQLFTNVGKMLSLGVTFATSVLMGGLQVMQGFTGSRSGCGEPMHGSCGCEPHHGGCHDYCGCGREAHHGGCHDSCGCGCDGFDSCCCHPGVHNCR